jgi:hypothetical protein
VYPVTAEPPFAGLVEIAVHDRTTELVDVDALLERVGATVGGDLTVAYVVLSTLGAEYPMALVASTLAMMFAPTARLNGEAVRTLMSIVHVTVAGALEVHADAGASA